MVWVTKRPLKGHKGLRTYSKQATELKELDGLCRLSLARVMRAWLGLGPTVTSHAEGVAATHRHLLSPALWSTQTMALGPASADITRQIIRPMYTS